MATIDTRTTECPACMQPNSGSTRCVPIPGCTVTNAQAIAAAWISKYNPDVVRAVLVKNGLVANSIAAQSLSQTQLANILYSYYTKNGAAAYGQLLFQIPAPTNLSAADTKLLADALPDIKTISPLSYTQQTGIPTTLDLGDTIKNGWNAFIGSATQTGGTTITTTTKASPVTIGLIIGGIAVLAIVAYVVVKS